MTSSSSMEPEDAPIPIPVANVPDVPVTRTGLGGPFGRRVAGVFATRVVQFGISIVTSILISRLLGPTDKGAFVAVSTLPGMLAAVGLLGLPSATNYFAGRGNSIRSLVVATFVFTAVLAVVLVGTVWIALPTLERSILRAAPDDLARVVLLTVPLGMLASFGGTILYGRQAVRTYNMILLGQSVLALLGAVVLLGVFHLGVRGAVAANVVVTIFLAVAVMEAVRRLGVRDRAGSPASLGAIALYGARVYPASVTGYFNYRADTYIIQALMVAPGLALGLYSMAVTLAELIFYVPDSVTTVFLPRVAGSTAEDANRMLGRVGRLTMAATLGCTVLLIPPAIIGIHVVLPAYVGCIPAFLAILPGVVSLSLAKVMSSYLSGRGRPGIVSVGALSALIVNVVMNIVLIPHLGIVGASLSSVASYSLLAAMMLVAASRLGGQRLTSLFVPGRVEIELLATGVRRVLGRGLLAVRATRS